MVAELFGKAQLPINAKGNTTVHKPITSQRSTTRWFPQAKNVQTRHAPYYLQYVVGPDSEQPYDVINFVSGLFAFQARHLLR